MSRVIIILLVFGIIVIGYLRLSYLKRRLFKEHNIVADYLEKFNLFIEKEDKDLTVYSSLLFDSDKIQNTIGNFGICDLRPPFANYLIKNYQIIINAIPEIKKELEDSYRISNKSGQNYIDLVTQSLIRYGGSSSELIKEYNSNLKNPIKWFLEGIKFVISLPIEFLLQIGLISERSARKIKASYLLKLISGIVTLISFFAAIIGILVGWKEFLNIIKNF
jgi:hypothetical protein